LGRCVPEFETLARRFFDLEELDRHPSSVLGLSGGFELVYLNPAWDEFARENQGQPAIGRFWDLGAGYFDAIAEPLRPFYRRLLSLAPDPGATPHPVSHEYECSTAVSFRKFNMQVYSLGQAMGFMIVHSLLVRRFHDPGERQPLTADYALYTDANGIIHQCCHCRRVRTVTKQVRWDWVPAWVEKRPADASHTICPICFNYYYPDEPPHVF
jgi:hypothetical protein